MSAARLANELGRLAARPDRERVVVYLNGPIDKEDRADLERNGVHLLNYLGSRAYFARLSQTLSAQQIASGGNVIAVEPIRAEVKLHPDLAAGIVHPWSIVDSARDDPDEVSPPREPDPVVAAYVLFHRDVDLEGEGGNAIARHHGSVRSWLRSVNGAVVHMRAADLPRLASEDAVMWVEPPLPAFVGLNDSNRALVGADTLQSPPWGLDGSGITVLVYDIGQIFAHDDFGTRLTIGAGDTGSVSDHATHVGGTIGGDGLLSAGQYRGMAPAVDLVSYTLEQANGTLTEGFLYTDPADIESDYAEAIGLHGVDIANNSIGTNTASNGFPCEWEGDYGVTGALIDAIAAGSLGDPFRIVWANGNERNGSARCGDTYLTTAPPACAKGHITVGAVNSDFDSITYFTSWGPCDDGRMKPDISAPGCQLSVDQGVTSTTWDNFDDYDAKCGTSMAAPTVTGVSALLLQHYRATYPGRPDFRNHTLKAVLAQTAEDIVSPGPDYQSGYGSVRAEPAAELIGEERFLEGEVLQGEVVEVYVEVGAADTELKVTLAWDDPPGTPNVDPALVNDLDLRVVGPDDTVYMPWTLDPANPADPAVRTSPNRLDNLEQVRVDLPAPGIYRVEIEGYVVAEGSGQTFGLAAAPSLPGCLSLGVVHASPKVTRCEMPIDLLLADCDLDQDSGLVESASVSISSDTESGGEVVSLQETQAASGRFAGSVLASESDSTGVLHVADGDTVTVSYLDADDGMGGLDEPRTDAVIMDCTAPSTIAVSMAQVLSNEATIAVDVDENTFARVHYGDSCAALTQTESGLFFSTTHELRLFPLAEDATYFFAVELEDGAGNVAIDDNGGACYSFTTLGPDGDHDGISNTTDNCIGKYNQDQSDVDSDGIGDLCDNCPGDHNPGQEDTEGFGSFGRQVIDGLAPRVTSTVHADLDGDGDDDVLAGAFAGDFVAWYENLDGVGGFGPRRLIDGTINASTAVFAADLDGDGDLDVLSASYYDLVGWYENLDGTGTFGPKHDISDVIARTRTVIAADLDGDDDLDVLIASSEAPLVIWYENLDGAGSFGPRQMLPAYGDWHVAAEDLDGDDDLDIVAVASERGLVHWIENLDGAGDFGAVHLITDSYTVPAWAHPADLDGDDDPDLVIVTYDTGEVSWWENSDGAGTFVLEQTFASDVLGAFSVDTTDFDGDGDLDVFVAGFFEIVWFEHLDGSGSFGPKQIVSDTVFGGRYVSAWNIDGDTDVDVLAVSNDEHVLAWWKHGGDGTGDVCDNCPTIENDDQSNQDGDVLGDACDNCPLIKNPAQDNMDGDVAGDLCDNCPVVPNDGQADNDSDGLGDACDPDIDGDTLANESDNCPYVANLDQNNCDMDSAGDVCDPCLCDANDDMDSDGICAGTGFNEPKIGDQDNCPSIHNPDQANNDTDSLGDACDNCDFVSNPNQTNTDGDVAGDACDNCRTIPNDGQTNSDTDPLGDACDNCDLVANREQSDIDDDGEGDHCDVDDGMIFLLHSNPNGMDWQQETGFDSWNWYRGAWDVFLATGQYTQTPSPGGVAARQCGLIVPQTSDFGHQPGPGEMKHFLVSGVSAGVEGDLGMANSGVRPNHNPCP